jgi:predicted AAA+ superfamily ATPase
LEQDLQVGIYGKELFPFSYPEYLIFTSAKAGPETFNEYLKKGGFPEYLRFGRSEILQELLNDIVMRDIVVRHKLRSPKSIKEMALSNLNIGVEFSYNSLAKTLTSVQLTALSLLFHI